jgi:K+-transporting ATPase ATPase A chain
MSVPSLAQIAVFLLILLALTRPLGSYMARVFAGERTFLSPVLGPLERLIYRACGIDPAVEQRWTAYTAGMLLFSAVSLLLTYALERLQGVLPFNPQGLGAVPAGLAFNTAVSFTTNTNWQNYAGEATMSYLTQMAGLAVHNFVSAPSASPSPSPSRAGWRGARPMPSATSGPTWCAPPSTSSCRSPSSWGWC